MTGAPGHDSSGGDTACVQGIHAVTRRPGHRNLSVTAMLHNSPAVPANYGKSERLGARGAKNSQPPGGEVALC